MVDIATFRQDFPEFADAAKYPDVQVQPLLDLAALVLPEDRWCDYLTRGIELFAAHNLALGAQAKRAASLPGGVPGLASGPLTSKAVGKVSASYDAALSAIDGGGPWNLTVYGQQFLWLARMIGSGGIQL